jgi:hypothetical protein
MLKGLALGLGIALALTGAVVHARDAGLNLRDLLSIGLSETPRSLKWGISKSEIQQRYPEFADAEGNAPGSSGFRLQGSITSQGCTFAVYLRSRDESQQLTLMRLEYRAGTLPECKARLESTLDAMYGPPAITKRAAGWMTVTSEATVSGPTVQSAWHSATTCLNLTWKDGTGYRGSPLTLALGDLQRECGYVDQVVPVHLNPEGIRARLLARQRGVESKALF